MLETEDIPSGLLAPGYYPPGGDENSEEELAVLPRHTKVVVTGNNRTKSVLVGLQGVVKKAVGLGGWHWLVLTNGSEVKLQRNALSVLESPTGDEEDDDIDIPFCSATSLDGFPRTFKPRIPTYKPANDLSKTADSSQTIESVPLKHIVEKKIHIGSRSNSDDHRMPMVDLSKLGTEPLRRYRQHFKLLDVGPNSAKEELLHAVGRHFTSHQVDEAEVISGFLRAAKRLKA